MQTVKCFLIVGLCCPATLGFATDNQLSPTEKAAGWKLLFDGKSYANWEDPARKSPHGDSFSTIEDGCLKAVAHPKIVEDLFTKEVFADFELEWDWKISHAGNSGVKYRIQDHLFLADQKTPRFEDLVQLSFDPRPIRSAKGQDYVIGFEYQMVDNSSNSDATRGGALHQAGALYDVEAPSKDATKPAGEFNHSRLVVRGDHVEHWMNGEKVVDASLKSPQVAAAMAKHWGEGSPVAKLLVDQPRERCPISLQNHEDAAWFKNVKVRELK